MQNVYPVSPAFEPLAWSRIVSHPWLQGGEYHASVASTNVRAAELTPQLERHQIPFLVFSEQQTHGRGRGDHRWYSTEGSLTLSIIWSPDLDHDGPLPPLSLVVGVALCRAVEQLCPRQQVTLKWPNDVYLNDRKVSGVLIETVGPAPSRHVIGMGINVQVDFQKAPDEVRSRATSLAEAAKQTLDRTTVLLHVLDELAECLRPKSLSQCLHQPPWNAYCQLRDTKVTVRTPHGDLTGLCRTIQSDGGLILDTVNGQRTIYSGEVVAFERTSLLTTFSFRDATS